MKFVMKLNAVVIVVMLVLFLAHGVMASLSTLGYYGNFGTKLSGIAYYLMFIHIILAFFRTFQMFIPELRSIKDYKTYTQNNGGVLKGTIQLFKKSNLLQKMKKQGTKFWITRISGIAFLALVWVHKTWIGQGASIGNVPAFILYALQIFFLASLLVHVLFNIVPLLNKFGIKNNKTIKIIAQTSLVAILILIIRGLTYYYFRV